MNKEKRGNNGGGERGKKERFLKKALRGKERNGWGSRDFKREKQRMNVNVGEKTTLF